MHLYNLKKKTFTSQKIHRQTKEPKIKTADLIGTAKIRFVFSKVVIANSSYEISSMKKFIVDTFPVIRLQKHLGTKHQARNLTK